MGFLDKFRKKEIFEDDYFVEKEQAVKKDDNFITFEDDIQTSSNASRNFKIKVFKLNDSSQLRNILDKIREENYLCLIDIHILKARDLDSLRNVIYKIQKTAQNIGGDVVGFSHDWIMVYPKSFSVEKSKKSQERERHTSEDLDGIY